ncbi:MAG: hypothetical protein AMJ81_00185 [Phycisphaerae bacterium SM23_33]|nr:MAG: hypothetical protein AMJ81_00185 [Phycisphaerae bacterium SM23_33]
MSKKEGLIEVEAHYDALGGVERYGYKWTGGDIARFSERLLLDAAKVCQARYDEFPCQPGDRFEFGPFKLRVLEPDSWQYDVIVAIRDRGFVTDLRYLWHRFGKLLDVAYRRAVVTLAVWRLAEQHEGALPTWRDVKALRRLADWERARKEK